MTWPLTLTVWRAPCILLSSPAVCIVCSCRSSAYRSKFYTRSAAKSAPESSRRRLSRVKRACDSTSGESARARTRRRARSTARAAIGGRALGFARVAGRRRRPTATWRVHAERTRPSRFPVDSALEKSRAALGRRPRGGIERPARARARLRCHDASLARPTRRVRALGASRTVPVPVPPRVRRTHRRGASPRVGAHRDAPSPNRQPRLPSPRRLRLVPHRRRGTLRVRSRARDRARLRRDRRRHRHTRRGRVPRQGCQGAEVPRRRLHGARVIRPRPRLGGKDRFRSPRRRLRHVVGGKRSGRRRGRHRRRRLARRRFDPRHRPRPRGRGHFLARGGITPRARRGRAGNRPTPRLPRDVHRGD